MSEKGKTVLILGNGFDLAHGLPTKYSDFLEFCRRIMRMWECYKNDRQKELQSFVTNLIKWNATESIINSLAGVFKNRIIDEDNWVKIDDEILNEIRKLVINNTWFLYLERIYKQQQFKGENWIDFEFRDMFYHTEYRY